MKAIIEIEDVDDDKFTVKSYYVGEGIYDPSSPSHRGVLSSMKLIKDSLKERGFKMDSEI